MDQAASRREIVDAARRMNDAGSNQSNQGTPDDAGPRCGGRMPLMPPAVPYDQMRPEDVAPMPPEGRRGAWTGPLEPSTEWCAHPDIPRTRPEAGAAVHAPTAHRAAPAMLRRRVTAVHDMAAALGGAAPRFGRSVVPPDAEIADAARGVSTPGVQDRAT